MTNSFTHVSFATIPVADPIRARDFYRDKLGLVVDVDAPYGETRWIMMAIPGARTRIHLDHRPSHTPGDQPVLPLISRDLEATVSALQVRGVTITTPPRVAEWNPEVRYAMIRDSEENAVLIATA
jgi:predicted enzyme related to lactoylglutathione lyase